MELQLHPLSRQCAVTGRDLAAGDRLVSFLVRGDGVEIVRHDLLASEEVRFTRPQGVICRWVHRCKARSADDNPERTLKLTAETLFLTLADSSEGEGDPSNAPLLQFLALMLERKRVLKPRGKSPDGGRDLYEHSRSKQLYTVPAGELTAELVLKIQDQLRLLVGGSTVPKKAPAPAAPTVS